jgi:hypothetical protein
VLGMLDKVIAAVPPLPTVVEVISVYVLGIMQPQFRKE